MIFKCEMLNANVGIKSHILRCKANHDCPSEIPICQDDLCMGCKTNSDCNEYMICNDDEE